MFLNIFEYKLYLILVEGSYGIWVPVTSNCERSYCGDCSDRMSFFPVVWTIRDGVASFTANDIFGTNSIWSVAIWYHKSQARHAKQKDVANKSWYLQKKKKCFRSSIFFTSPFLSTPKKLLNVTFLKPGTLLISWWVWFIPLWLYRGPVYMTFSLKM